MALAHWKKLTELVVHSNPWWTYKRDEFELPSGKRGEYHYTHTNGSSMVIPLLDSGAILMVNQYRYLVDRESMEFPCGSVKDGSGYDQTAWQELSEETGYAARELLQIGEFNPYNGITDEMCRVYVARGLTYVGGTPDETEEFELLKLTADDIDSGIRRGKIWDGMSIAAWSIFKTRMKDML